ncbi:hypothetical protein CSE16_09160 [Solibacillus sp. R5-41]|uniref:hypothetical protein n=1 Tax=Solibacillus sp. R5-41 TaxID=2048654 RepID=UPI000C1260EB|nr:hypothetical protein [Solibacillus sp. R5-41]ATP40198.1 hypothetical protein CSE16_09160 [Solibacillus sp. R5-41]
MLNPKKLQLSYKRYCKNFVDGIKFEDVEKRYLNSQSKITHIVELNDVEKDHILLIRLGSIESHNFSKWKRDVLVNHEKKSDELKKIMMVIFHQCMAQSLYKSRYPKMFVEYTFRDAIMTLIHFTMFGWEKEEDILFNFIVDHFDSRWMNANDLNKHTWFLLELYLQFRNKTIFGTNQNLHKAVKEQFKKMDLEYGLIPEELNVYTEVLKHWETPQLDEIKTLIDKMSVFHSILASELGESIEFGDFGYGFYPYEILFLLFVRKKRRLPIPEEFDDFLMNTPEAKMIISDPEPYPEWDPLLKLIDGFYRKNYPDYIPNRYGELFQN